MKKHITATEAANLSNDLSEANESDLSRAVQSTLKRMGVWFMRLNAGTAKRGGRHIRLAPAGCPDICLPGLAAWIELKTEK